MTRTVYDPGVRGTNVQTITNLSTGAVTTTSTQSSYSGMFFRQVRSDITKTTRDSSGWRKPTPYTVSVDSWKQPSGGFDYVANGKRYVEEGTERPRIKMSASLPSFQPGLRSRAEVRALEKLKEAKVNLPQAFFEREQTIRLVTTSTRRLTSIVRGFVDHKSVIRLGTKLRRNPSLLFKEISDLWLEYMYGWRPLVDDIYGAVEILDAAEQREGPRRHRICVRGRSREDSKVMKVINDGSNGRWVGYETTRTMQGCSVSLYYEPDVTSPFQSLAQAGVINPALLAWELLPYSFIADWVLPIGSWLNTLDANVGWKFLGGTRTEIIRVRQHTDYQLGPKAKTYKVSFVRGTDRAHRFSMKRTVYAGSPIATFPRLKDPRSLVHLNNAIALLYSACYGGHKVRQ